MKTEIQKITKIFEIMTELYEMNPKYFIDCFFDMYFQMKKKAVIDERSYGNEELKKQLWNAVNLFNHLVRDKKEPAEKAFTIAYKKFKVDKDILSGVINSCRAFKSAKKTRFKNLL